MPALVLLSLLLLLLQITSPVLGVAAVPEVSSTPVDQEALPRLQISSHSRHTISWQAKDHLLPHKLVSSHSAQTHQSLHVLLKHHGRCKVAVQRHVTSSRACKASKNMRLVWR